MDNEMPVVAEAVAQEEKPVVNSALETLNAQQVNFKNQLEQVKKDMSRLQQEFEAKKILGIRLEGAIEAGEILLKNLSK